MAHPLAEPYSVGHELGENKPEEMITISSELKGCFLLRNTLVSREMNEIPHWDSGISFVSPHLPGPLGTLSAPKNGDTSRGNSLFVVGT